MTVADLSRRIRLGEDSTLELKRVVLSDERIVSPHRNEFADELAAFANSRGGTLVLGVDDATREVLGIPLEGLDAVEGWVREICNDSVNPALSVDIRKLELPDAAGTLVPVICIDIPRSLFVHKSPGGYFRRIGSSKREMAAEFLARLFQERSQSRVIRFDESVVPRTLPAHLDEELTRRFLREDAELTEDTLHKLRIVAADEEDDLGGVAQSIAKKLSVERAHGRGNVRSRDPKHHADLARPLIDHLYVDSGAGKGTASAAC